MPLLSWENHLTVGLHHVCGHVRKLQYGNTNLNLRKSTFTNTLKSWYSLLVDMDEFIRVTNPALTTSFLLIRPHQCAMFLRKPITTIIRLLSISSSSETVVYIIWWSRLEAKGYKTLRLMCLNRVSSPRTTTFIFYEKKGFFQFLSQRTATMSV